MWVQASAGDKYRGRDEVFFSKPILQTVSYLVAVALDWLTGPIASILTSRSRPTPEHPEHDSAERQALG